MTVLRRPASVSICIQVFVELLWVSIERRLVACACAPHGRFAASAFPAAFTQTVMGVLEKVRISRSIAPLSTGTQIKAIEGALLNILMKLFKSNSLSN